MFSEFAVSSAITMTSVPVSTLNTAARTLMLILQIQVWLESESMVLG